MISLNDEIANQLKDSSKNILKIKYSEFCSDQEKIIAEIHGWIVRRFDVLLDLDLKMSQPAENWNHSSETERKEIRKALSKL